MKSLKIYIFLLFVFSSLFFSCEDKDSAKAQVPASIVVTPVNSILKPNQIIQLYSLVIDKNGTVTTKSKGSATIIATVDNIQGMAEIVVSAIRRKILSEMFTSST